MCPEIHRCRGYRCSARPNEDSSFVRRHNQEQSSACGLEAVQSMLAVCCPGGEAGTGHRLLQVNGCCSLPPTCSPKCSSQFISILKTVLEQLPPGQLAGWTGFLGFQVSRGAAISRGALSCRCPTCYDFSLSRACRCGTIAG